MPSICEKIKNIITHIRFKSTCCNKTEIHNETIIIKKEDSHHDEKKTNDVLFNNIAG